MTPSKLGLNVLVKSEKNIIYYTWNTIIFFFVNKLCFRSVPSHFKPFQTMLFVRVRILSFMAGPQVYGHCKDGNEISL